MTDFSTERNIRARLPVTRLLSAYLPLRLSHWLIKQGVARMRRPRDTTRERVSAHGVPCEWLTPAASPNLATLSPARQCAMVSWPSMCASCIAAAISSPV